MDSGQHRSHDLACLEHLTGECPCIMPAGVAVAALLYRNELSCKPLLLHSQQAIVGEHCAVPCNAGGIDTVQHIHTVLECLKHIFRSSHTHKIVGFVLVKVFAGIGQEIFEGRWLLPYRKAAYGDSRQVQGIDELGTLLPQILKEVALHYTKKIAVPLIFAAEPFFLAPLCPPVGYLHGFHSLFLFYSRRCALIQCHEYVASEAALQLDSQLRRKHVV